MDTPIHPTARDRALRSALVLLVVTALGACASSGEPQSPPVPVFFSEGDVPCAFERTGSVREEVYPERDLEALLRRVMGRAGARRGADAVLVDRERGPFTVVAGGGRQVSAGPDRVPVEGELLRFVDPACAG